MEEYYSGYSFEGCEEYHEDCVEDDHEYYEHYEDTDEDSDNNDETDFRILPLKPLKEEHRLIHTIFSQSQ